MNPSHDDDAAREVVDAMLRAAPAPHDFAEVERGTVEDPPLVDIEPVDSPAHGSRTERARPRRGVLVAAVVLFVVALVGSAWVFLANRPDDHHHGRVLTSPAARTLLHALGTSTGTGGYEVDYDFTIDRAATTGPPCPSYLTVPLDRNAATARGTGTSPTTIVSSGSAVSVDPGPASPPVEKPSGPISCGSFPGGTVTVTGHGTVHLNPYFLETTSTVTDLGEVAVSTDGNLIVEHGGGNYGNVRDGQPLSGFRSLVETTFGQGPGALTMLGLASPTGYLSLSADAVTAVSPAGTGTAAGVPVTFYDVTSDVDAMRNLPGLTDEQRTTIDESLRSLHAAGFQEATARIAVDADGYIRESTSDARFSDGTTMHRHMTLSKFGCVSPGPTPVHPDATDTPPPDCAPTASTTTPVGPDPSAQDAVPTTTTAAPDTPSTTSVSSFSSPSTTQPSATTNTSGP